MTTGVATESEEAPTVGKITADEAVRVSQRIEASLTRVWEVLVSPAGSSALLGSGAVLGTKGEPYHTVDGTSGVVRSYHPLEQLRVSWHADADAPPSLVEIDLRADAGGTLVELRHDRIADAQTRSAAEERWVEGLRALAECVSTSGA